MESNYKSVLTYDNLSENIRNFKYAVRGPIVLKAVEYEKRLKAGEKLPFTELLFLNVGNPQLLNQPPISFHRQIIACLMNSTLLEKKVFHQDILKRAENYQKMIKNIGAYSNSQGYSFARESVAKYIEKRDGFPSSPDHIFLTNGAGDAVKVSLQCLIKSKTDCILIPVPRYPLYSAEIELHGGSMQGYYLDESKNWGLSVEELERAYAEAVSKGLKPKAIVVINPGNPTGAILSKENIEQVCKFTFSKSLVILADEVYQFNVYDPKKQFHSFKKVLCELGAPYSQNQELFSYHSASKGVIGECGLRGGYMELFNIENKVRAEILKMLSVFLCSSTVGQMSVELMCNPPTLDSCSKETVEAYNTEVLGLLESLKRRAKISTDYLKKMTNITTNEVEGAMYAFPQIKFSKSAVEAAKKQGMNPDEFYCFSALDETGIVMVPGSGFGQVEGTHHFRITTLLYPEIKTEESMKKLHEFNESFHKKYP